MIPEQFLALYLAANVIALGVLVVAFTRPRLTRWLCAGIFAWAAVTNTLTALATPQVYLEYADLTMSDWYRSFILGWFRGHIQWMVLTIAAGQAVIAGLLTRPRPWRRLGVAGGVVFLAAIAPLGVGSGFPFSVTFSAALIAFDQRLAANNLIHRTPGADRVTA